MAGSKSSSNSLRSSLVCFAAAMLVMSCAAAWFYSTGTTLYWGDAEAHLNIARRMVDSRTPGLDQIGTTWLPLPHLVMVPFVRDLHLWQTGLAGAIPSAICMALAASFLFAALRRMTLSGVGATTGTAVFLLNPNTLYLGSIPMSEPVYFASFFALLYFTVVFAESNGTGALLGASMSALCCALTRYEGWFVLPFAAVYVLLRARSRRAFAFLFFCFAAALGPAMWMLHNRWYFGDALYFYRGPYSAKAIQRGLPYPGLGNWRVAVQYFSAAGELIAGWPALIVGGVGCVLALVHRSVWPVLLCFLPPAFYVLSMYSSGGTPIFVPQLAPHGFYNIRYAAVLLPLVAIGAAAIGKFGRPAALAVVLLAFGPFALHFREHPIALQEADVNSRGRRAWTAEAVRFLRSAKGPHETFFTSFGNLTAIYRELGVPLRETLTGDNNPEFLMALTLPRYFLHEDWAIATGGDPVQTAVDRARLKGPDYQLSRRIIVKGQPVIEIYHRQYDNPLR